MLAGVAGCTGNFVTGRQNGDSADSHDGHATKKDQGGHGHGITVPNQPAHSATVTMKTRDGSSHFEPHVVWVERGGNVTFETESGTHTATAYHPENDSPRRVPDGAPPWDSGNLTVDDGPYERTFEVTGIHDFYCRPHQAQGMVGTVIVGQPQNADQAGLSEPGEELPDSARSKIQVLNDAILDNVDSLS